MVRVRIEWAVEFYRYQPGIYSAPVSEREALLWVRAEPEHVRMVSRTVTVTDWEPARIAQDEAESFETR